MKPNAWILTEIPKELLFSKSKPNKRKQKVFASTQVKEGWGYLAQEDGGEDRISIEGLSEKQLQQMIFQCFSTAFSKNGLRRVDRKRNNRFLYRENAGRLDDFFVNSGFEFSISQLSGHWLLLVKPLRIVTPDGKKYNPEFAKEKNPILLAKGKGLVKYGPLVTIIDTVEETLEGIEAIEFGQLGRLAYRPAGKIKQQQSKIYSIPEPEIDFGNGNYAHWPKLGLERYGPLDYNELNEDKPDSISITFIGDRSAFDLLTKLNRGEEKKQRGFPGFSNIYRAKLQMGQSRFLDIGDEVEEVPFNQDGFVDYILKKQLALSNQGVQSDLTIVYLSPKLEPLFNEGGNNLRDRIKTAFWKQRIVTQIITDNSIRGDTTGTLYNLSLGIYYKAGGNPWRLKTSESGIAYVGITFGVSKDGGKRLIGLAELFDCYGQFMSMRSIRIREIKENPKERDLHLKKNQLKGILSDLLADYAEAMDGSFPKELVIHKSSDFNEAESGAIEALSEYPVNFTSVYLQRRHFWNLITDDRKEPTRGVCWELDSKTALLYTSGIIQNQSAYFLPGSPVPLLVHLVDSPSFKLSDLCAQVMMLTKLNFNSTNTYSREPATTLYSRGIIDLLRAGLDSSLIPENPRYFL